MLCSWPLRVLESLELNGLARNGISLIQKIGSATCSELFADASRVVGDRYPICKLVSKFALDCNTSTEYLVSAKSETGRCAGGNDSVSVLLYLLC